MSREGDKEGGHSRTPPRERIVETARDLFRKHGLRGVGVDAIAEAAGTNKMTLYRHFGSKDDLIAACLTEAGREAAQEWDEWDAEFPGAPDEPAARMDRLRGRPARSKIRAVATSPMPPSRSPNPIIRRARSSPRSSPTTATVWPGSAATPGSRTPNCSPTP